MEAIRSFVVPQLLPGLQHASCAGELAPWLQLSQACSLPSSPSIQFFSWRGSCPLFQDRVSPLVRITQFKHTVQKWFQVFSWLLCLDLATQLARTALTVLPGLCLSPGQSYPSTDMVGSVVCAGKFWSHCCGLLALLWSRPIWGGLLCALALSSF